MTGTPILKTWWHMIQRCENPNHPGYKNYGGRGIKICERWYDPRNFYADVGNRPDGMTLDRWPDNDGDYEPTNWRWATPSQQRLNSRSASCGPFKQCWFFAYNENTGEWDEDDNQCMFARRWNLDNSHISHCLRGRQKAHKGWTFQWIPKQQGEKI